MADEADGRGGDFASGDVLAMLHDYDGCPAQGSVDIGAYSLLIFSQDTEVGTNG